MNFFNTEPAVVFFNSYDTAHILVIAFFAAVIVLTVIFSKKIQVSKYEKLIRFIPSFLVIAMEIAFYIWRGVYQKASVLTELLPLDLCTITLYLCIVLNFTKQKKIFNIIYFYALGSAMSIIFPDLYGYSYNHFRFYHFFFTHGYIVVTAVYFITVHRYKITFEDAVRAAGILILMAFGVIILDYVLNANYMYLMQKPESFSPLNFFGAWPEYLIGLMMLSLLSFAIIYIPWIFLNKKASNLPADS